MAKKGEKPEVKAGAIAAELFSLVEREQGASFISDGMEEMDRETFLDCVESSLLSTLETARLFRAFLKKHGRSGQPNAKPR